MRSVLSHCAAVIAAGVAAVSIPPAAEAQPQPPKISTAHFAALPVFRRPLLSPDGRRIAARATADGKTTLVIFDADRPEATPQKIPIGTSNVQALRWAGNQRLLLTVQSAHKFRDGGEIPFWRLLAIDLSGGAGRLMDPTSRGILAGDVLYTDPTGSWALVASQDHAFVYPSVKRVDLTTGEAVVIEKARDDVWDWYADDKGVVRAGVSYQGSRWTLWYRDSPEEKLRRLTGKFANQEDTAVDRLIFGRDQNNWVITNERTGRFGLYKYDLKTGVVGAALFENPTVDLDDVTYNAVTGEISSISYEDDRPRTMWLEEAMRKLQAKLDRALPNSVNRTIDWSADEKRALVWSGSASDPGGYFLLDRSTSKMHSIGDPYPDIVPAQLAPVKMVRYQARDGLTLPAYLTLPVGRPASGLPLVVMPHGGPFERDRWEYDPLVQFLANRGYAVLQPQFRGSTGFGKDFVAKGYGEWGRKMQDDLDDGLDWLVRSGQVDPKRVCIFGMSYGGYAALWAAVRNPERYRCAASYAGVTDVKDMLRSHRKLFSATRYFREWRTKVGGEGKADLAAVSPINFAERIKMPILIGHGKADDTVPVSHSQRMVEALHRANANVSHVYYEGGHGFTSSAELEDWLRRLEQFLASHNPA